MPKSFILQKTYDVDTTYRAEEDKALVINQIGTNSGTRARATIAGSPVAEFYDDIAPLAKTTSNILGPLDLGDLYLVVPPKKPFSFSGASGFKFNCIGKILELAPGEALPTPLAARAGVQARENINYLTKTYSHGTDVTWAAGDENTVIDWTCPPGEKWILKAFMGTNIANLPATLTAGQFGIRIYIEDKPYDVIETEMGKLGIDAFEMALPPRDALTLDIFSLKDMPIELVAGRNIKVKAINISGAGITPPTGTSIEVTTSIGAEKYII